MAAIGILLALFLCSSTIQSADIPVEDFLKREWSEDWIEKAPPGFGSTWMIYEDENGNVQIANISAIPPTPASQFDDDTDQVTFTLYTRKTDENPELLNVDEPKYLEKTAFNPSHPVKIVTHGWQSSGKSVAVQGIRKAYLQRGEYNVIAVDWSKLASTYNYATAVTSTQDVGKKVANVIEEILDTYKESSGSSRRRRDAQENDLLSKIHILGHSLGAHVAGNAGRAMGAKKVGRITDTHIVQIFEVLHGLDATNAFHIVKTGLDPARPGFELYDMVPSLSKDDAQFVDVIHTTAGTLGVKESIGHVDFYPNGGYAIQPGCCCIIGIIETCSHGRAYRYYAETINSDEMVGVRCDTYKDFKWGVCNGKEKAVMGEDVPLSTRGIFYLNTNGEAPFAMVGGKSRTLDSNSLTESRIDED